MSYKYLTETTLAKIDADGKFRMSCTTEHPEYLAWLASPCGNCEGRGAVPTDDFKSVVQCPVCKGMQRNTPEPADHLPPPGYTCSPWQIRKALNNQSLRQGVEDAIAASTDITLKDGWEFASAFRSDDPFVISMGAALGKIEEETKLLIQYASTL